jgi:serine/threonine protein kinase
MGEPPHANVHPMRAIFMIPNSDPPTLPEPHKWSKDFNDFLKVCLQKDPAKRPSAETLLKSSAFITKAKSKKIIADLVDQCLPEIDEYREQEAKEADGKEGDEATLGSDISTLQESNTIVSGSKNDDTGDFDSGTMVPAKKSAGNKTKVPQVDEDEDDGPQYGTMVQKKPTNDSTIIVGNNVKQEMRGTTSAPKKGETPAYMSSVKSNDPRSPAKQPAQPANNQAKPNGTSGAAGRGAGDRKDQFNLYYKTGKMDVPADATLMELRQQLIELNNAYDEEMNALEKFYAEKRKTLQSLIAKKEKEEALAKAAQKGKK